MATITRNEVASVLGVSVATVRRMEGKTLHPKLIDGAWRFELDEVKVVQRSPPPASRRLPSDGELAAEIFRRFDEGQSLRQIVRECRQLPKLVRALYQEWAAPLDERAGCDLIDESTINDRDEKEIARWERAMSSLASIDEGLDLRQHAARDSRRSRSLVFRRPPH